MSNNTFTKFPVRHEGRISDAFCKTLSCTVHNKFSYTRDFTFFSASKFSLCLQHKIHINSNKTFDIAKLDQMQRKRRKWRR